MAFNITVLYGSETGTAQDTAEQIWRDAKRYNLKCTVGAMDDYDIENLALEKLVVFVASTTGQGEPPLNMRRFWRFLLRKSLPTNLLTRLRYAVLGLGDSSYQKFNFAAKKLNRRLAQLGAVELQSIGLADDQHDLGIDAVVGPWTERLWENVENAFDVHRNATLNSDAVIERFDVRVVDEDPLWRDSHDDIYRRDENSSETIKIGTVLENKKTTSEEHFQDVRLIRLRADGVEYLPGDVLYVRPKNSAKQVREFFRVLNDNGVRIHPDTVIRITEKEIKLPSVLSHNLTLKQLAEQYWDLSFKPRRSTMRILSQISENELERDKLTEFTTANGQEELFNYVNRPRRNIVEVLNDFPHTTNKLNVELLFEVMSPIKPRAFSIASSSRHTPNEVHVLVAVVKYKTKLLEHRLGLCSNWLASLKVGDEIVFWIRSGTFKFDYGKPMILIGPGTGVAPFRSLLLQRFASNEDLGDCVLFFGCRNERKDYHCREDFERMSRDGNLRVFCAFSRDQDRKIYVQHVIRREGLLCWELLRYGANVYLAGSSKNMPNGVREEFVELAKNIGNMTEEEAKGFVDRLEKDGRYQIETWA